MYKGHIINDGDIKDVNRVVTYNDEPPIPMRLELVSHSPTGFCWGYFGSGPAQLALAILCDYLKDDKRALAMYQDFKNKVIAALPMDEDFTLQDRTIDDFITLWEIDRAKAF